MVVIVAQKNITATPAVLIVTADGVSFLFFFSQIACSASCLQHLPMLAFN